MAREEEVEITLTFESEAEEKQWFDLSTLEQREDLMNASKGFRGLPLFDQGVVLAKLNKKEVKPIIQERLSKELGIQVDLVGNRLVPATQISVPQRKVLKVLEKAIDAGATAVQKTLDVLFTPIAEQAGPESLVTKGIDVLVGLENLEFLEKELPTKVREKFRAVKADALQKETKGVLGTIVRKINLPQRLMQNVLVEFMALNLEALSSPAFILSFSPGGQVSQRILQANRLALRGLPKQAAQELTKAVRVRSLKDVARKTIGEVAGVAGGVSELITGFTPFRRGALTFGGAALAPAIGLVGRGVAGLGRQIPVSARRAEDIRKFTTPGVSLGPEATLVVPKAETNVTQLVTEAFGRRGTALTAAARPTVRPALFRMQTESEGVFREAAKEVAFLKANKLTQVESRLAAEAVEQGIARDRLDLSKFKGSTKSLLVAERVGNKLGEVGRQLVQAGFDTRGVKRLMDQYLTRIYAMHEIPLADKGNVFVRRARRKKAAIRLGEAERLLARRDLSRAERRRLGEVLEVEPRFVKGLITGKQLAAFGRLQQELAKVPGAVRNTSAGPNWIQLPRTPRIIKRLQGKWVEFENAREVFAWDDLARELGSPALDKKFLRFFKEVSTVDNPVVWMGNIGFNFFIADARRLGGPLGFVPFLLRSTGEMMRGSKKVQQAIDDGVFGSGFQDRRSFRQVLGKHVLEAKETSGHMLGMSLSSVAYRKNSALRASVTNVRDFFRNFYKSQDDIFRFWAYDDGLRLGLTRQQAAERARTMFVDYSDVPVAMRRLSGQIGTGSALLTPQPFMSWQYSMTPQMMKAMVENPMALARWRHFLDAYNTSALINQGKDPQLVNAYREAQVLQADSAKEKFFARNMPYIVAWNPSAAGDTMISQVARFSPLGDAVTGRIFSFNPFQNALLSTIFDKQIFGTELGPRIPEGELVQNVARVFNFPAPIVRSALREGLVSRAKLDTETGEPLNMEARLLLIAFGRTAIPKARPFLTPRERFGQAFTGRFRPVSFGLELERQRALKTILRKRGVAEKDIEDRVQRAVILEEIQRLAAQQGQEVRQP